MSDSLPREEKKEIIQPKDSIKHLYAHIQKMPDLIQQSKLIDKILLNQFPDLKKISSEIINQFTEQKQLILKKFDNWIMPIATEVLDLMISDAKKSQEKLQAKFDQLKDISETEWQNEAQHWMKLHAKWNDRKGLISKILETVSLRTKHLIEKDIQIIKDYQNQSLSHLSKESEAFIRTEQRLAQAIEEPLKKLTALKNQPVNPTSLQQASEWIENLHQRRESYFDQLLMKIDHVIKDVVHIDSEEETNDSTLFLDVEGDLVFMENELHDINKDVINVSLLKDCDKQFILGRLEGLLDHAEQIKNQSLPHALKKRISALENGVRYTISRFG